MSRSRVSMVTRQRIESSSRRLPQPGMMRANEFRNVTPTREYWKYLNFVYCSPFPRHFSVKSLSTTLLVKFQFATFAGGMLRHQTINGIEFFCKPKSYKFLANLILWIYSCQDSYGSCWAPCRGKASKPTLNPHQFRLPFSVSDISSRWNEQKISFCSRRFVIF